MLALFIVLLVAQESVDSAMRLAAAGRVDEARSVLGRLVEQNPQDADLRYRLGLIQLKQKQLDLAVATLNQATRLAPRMAMAWLALAEAHLRQGHRDAALGDAKHAEVQAGASAPAWKALAFLAARTGDGAAQGRALEALLRLEPQERAPYAQLAALRLDRREADLARRVADAALVRFPDDAEFLRLRGLALYALGRKPEAIDTFLAAMDAAPGNDVVHASIETLLPDAGDRLPKIRERLERFEIRQSVGPLGPFLLALVTPEGAERNLRKALERDPQFWPAWFELSKILHDPAERRQALERTLTLNQNHEGAHFALAQLYLDQGDPEKARLHRTEHHRLRQAASAK